MLMMMAKGEYVFDGSMMVYVDGADDVDLMLIMTMLMLTMMVMVNSLLSVMT